MLSFIISLKAETNPNGKFGGFHASYNFLYPSNKELSDYYSLVPGARLGYHFNWKLAPYLSFSYITEEVDVDLSPTDSIEIIIPSFHLGVNYWHHPAKSAYLYFGAGIKYVYYIENCYGNYSKVTANEESWWYLEQSILKGFGVDLSIGTKIQVFKKLYSFIEYSIGYTPLGEKDLNVDGHVIRVGLKI